MLALGKHLSQMGQDVTLLASTSKRYSDPHLRLISVGKPWPFPSSGSVARVSITPWLSVQVKHILKSEKFDIIHLHEPFCPVLCTTVLGQSKTINVGTFHAVDSRHYGIAKPILGYKMNQLFNKLHGRIAVSKTAKEFTQKYLPGEFKLIPNGIDLERFFPDVHPIEKYMDGKLNILFVGRLEKRKGIDHLLAAYKMIKTDLVNSRLILVGANTRWSQKIVGQIDNKLKRDIVFVGSVSDSELPSYYATADIFCSPATGRESFGIVLLEAMAMGKPIMASNITGYANVVTHKSEGLLAAPADVKDLAKNILFLADNPATRRQMGNNGIQKAKQYSWPSIAQQILNLYQELLDHYT